MKLFFHEQWQAFWVAVQFLTQFPVKLRTYPKVRVQALSLLYYPLVGAFIGAVLMGISWIMRDQSIYLQATLVLTAWVVLTGGLHLDGLADSADGWMGGLGDADRTLQIMKDPCTGAIGALALILILMLKWSALVTLLPAGNLLPIMIASIMARLGAVALLSSTPYVRVQGIASVMIPLMPLKGIYALVMIGALWLVWLNVIWLLVVSIVFWMARRAMLARIKGTTGDTAGALIEVLEALLLTVACFTLEV
ncbi:adenosylcobinamide-GDP ribazoletransferase [Neptunomonas antarctica]|uniref:adenosylcobinamide-GDP ribazoletransferase n=1 Tax=Neptunomonas antarctica TaxID=619304 RepID=UPI0006C80BAA|nr:adenosylcobinamide-GDP ribazoletransferase [Neptunomonas antarctica]